MSRIDRDALLLRKRVDLLSYTPQFLAIITVCIVIDLVFWYFCLESAPANRSPFVGAGSTWLAASVTYAATWIKAATDQAKESRKDRKTAYTNFLSASDDFVMANDRHAATEREYDNANNALAAAQRQYESDPTEDNRRARITAEARADVISRSLKDTTTDTENRRGVYEAASKEADRLVPRSVRLAFEDFRQCQPRDSPYRTATRSRFIAAARDDVKLTQRADESTL
jgi:hypothetical protein